MSIRKTFMLFNFMELELGSLAVMECFMTIRIIFDMDSLGHGSICLSISCIILGLAFLSGNIVVTRCFLIFRA